MSDRCDRCGELLGAPHRLLNNDCILGHADHAERFVGYSCKRHHHWIDATLVQIEELFALADDIVVPMLNNGLNTERAASPDGSPAPGRIELMAITDGRIVPRNKALTRYLNDDGRGGLESNGDDLPDVPGSLASWARMVVEERQTTDALTGGVCQSVRVLRRERIWIAQQAWLDDYATELAALHRAVARAVGDTMWPRPIGKCPNCGVPMYPTIGVDEARCTRCKSVWVGKALLRLRLIHEREETRT